MTSQAGDRRRSSLKALFELYTVVVGVALSLGVVSLVGAERGLLDVNRQALYLSVAFLVTLIPFYHGAMRHLWDAYLEQPNAHLKRGALLIDYALLFIHALTFVVLALLLNKPSQYAWTMVVLLCLDTIWGGYAHFGASSRTSGSSPEGRWALINLFAALIGIFALISWDVTLDSFANAHKLSQLICVLAVARTTVDYVWCHKFYFPDD